MHQTFDDVELYDTHRAGGGCAPPSTLLGMVKDKGGIWVRRADVRQAS